MELSKRTQAVFLLRKNGVSVKRRKGVTGFSCGRCGSVCYGCTEGDLWSTPIKFVLILIKPLFQNIPPPRESVPFQ